MDFCLLLKIWITILVKISVKTCVVNKIKNLLIMVNNRQQMHLKLLQKESFKKQQKKLVICLVRKLLIKLWGLQKIDNRIIKKQLQMNMIKKHLKKDKYLQKKYRKLLMI